VQPNGLALLNSLNFLGGCASLGRFCNRKLELDRCPVSMLGPAAMNVLGSAVVWGSAQRRGVVFVCSRPRAC